MRALFTFLCLIVTAPLARAATTYVSTSGSDVNPGTQSQPWRTIQKACDSATPGTTISVAKGTYNEKIVIRKSGNATGGYICLQGEPGAVIRGVNKVGDHLIYLNNQSYVRITGFELRDNIGVTDGSAIRVEGSGNHLEFRNNKIHDVRGKNAMGITVYGTNGSKSISDLIIDNNEIYNCQPAPSEALTLNGNVSKFQVSNNYVHDVNNIGIDMIGGEGMCPTPGNDAARQGTCTNNRVVKAHSADEGGYASGIYVDGGRDIVVERNFVTRCDVGIAVGAENSGTIASGVVVRDNVISKNEKRGLSFGGYDASRGRVKNCWFTNNTCYQNDTLATGDGELHIEFASENVVKNNLFYAGPQNLLLTVVKDGISNVLDNNLYYSKAGSTGSTFLWRDNLYTGFDRYKNASGKDAASPFLNPRLTEGLHPGPSSPAVNAGDPAFKKAPGETAFDGDPRVFDGRVDIGAFEVQNNSPVNRGVSLSSTKSAPGTPRTFTASWSDLDGAVDIKEVSFLISPSGDVRNALHVFYNAQTNRIYLRNNAGTGWVAGSGAAAGSTVAPLRNSQGSLDVSTVGVTRSGNNLAIRWTFTPSASFAGIKNIFISALDNAGGMDDLEDKADWNIVSPSNSTSSNAF